MTCFWTDLVSTTQFCDAPAGGGLFIGLASVYTDPISSGSRWGATVDTDGAPASLAGAMAAVVAAPLVAADNTAGGISANPFFVKRANPALAGYVSAGSAFVSGISGAETTPKTTNMAAYVNPREDGNEGAGFELGFDDTLDSVSLTVTEAYLCFMQQNSAAMTLHGVAVAALPAARFTVGLPLTNTLRIDYAGGSSPAVGDYTLYGSADTEDAVNATGHILTIIRVVGTAVTASSGVIDVDCYITGYRNGNV